MTFTHVLRPQDRPPILGELRDTLTEEWGPRYGWAILNQQMLESPHADIVVRAITSKPNALSEYHQALAERLDEARLKRAQVAQRRPRRARPPNTPSAEEPLELQDEPTISKRDASAHTKALNELISLGKITGCSVWIAADNHGRTYAGKSLAADCLKKLPRTLSLPPSRLIRALGGAFLTRTTAASLALCAIEQPHVAQKSPFARAGPNPTARPSQAQGPRSQPPQMR
jgi:hypothetical protein